MTDEEFLLLDQGAAGRYIQRSVKGPEKDRLFALYAQHHQAAQSASRWAELNAQYNVALPRIGGGKVCFVIGGVLLAIGAFASAAGAGGSEGATAIGAGAIGFGGAIISLGFLISLFSRIEARLIDIQSAIVGAPHSVTLVAPSNAPDAANEVVTRLSDRDAMEKYGISYDGEKYVFQTFKYDALSDAINYAKKTLTL